jgi:uncharacterized membrane protein YfcA
MTYGNDGRFLITTVKLVIAAFMVLFALIEVLPRWRDLAFAKKYLPVGGIISGFFGGISGHQGALRSAFLVRAGLTKESFLGTNIVIACLVDISRLAVYMRHFTASGFQSNNLLIAITTLSAFLGAFLGARLIRKITLQWIRVFISILLFLLAGALAAGIV